MTFTSEFSAVLGNLQMPKKQTCSRVRLMSVTNPDTTSGVEIDLAETYSGYSSLVVKVTDSWLACHEFEPSIAEEPPFRGSRCS
ncbi:hypothetical protein TNCV_871021 [Trichonephila clavipes]|nr:hypothetical protein TNCV_871021 [Trichonephila clavipes]